MGKKYILELPNGCGISKIDDGVTLTPYTEPDLEQIRKEAYEEGYKKCLSLNNFGHLCVSCDKYEQGLADAWEAARKICHMNSMTRDEVFGLVITSNIFDENTASEAIEKIRQYEQKKEIQVGDEVNAPFGKAIVVNINSVAEKIWLVYADGHGGFEFFKDAPPKTGRHFPEIAEVFAKMKESDNG